MTGTPETITRDELARALAVGCMSGEITLSAVSDVVADGLFKIVLHNREPEYEPGGAYVDARGDNYLRSSSGGWVDYSTTWHPHGSPRRPLRRLVPDHAHPDHAVILAEIVAWADTGYVFKDLADRMCRLLEGSSGD